MNAIKPQEKKTEGMVFTEEQAANLVCFIDKGVSQHIKLHLALKPCEWGATCGLAVLIQYLRGRGYEVRP